MFRAHVRVALMAGAVALPGALMAAADPQVTKSVQTLIFDTPHMSLVSKGRELTYRYEHTVSSEALLGKPFSDNIRVRVLKVDATGKRDVDMKVFGGEYERKWGESGLTLNPIFIWYMNNSVNQYQRLAGGGEYPYLKDRFSKAFVEKNEIEAAKIQFDGKEVDGYKLTLTPYAGDKNVRKMQGFEKSTFVVTFSPDVPGYFVEMTANIESRKSNTPKMTERLTLVKVGD